MGALTERVIGAAITVHRALGPGFLESIYEAALGVKLRAQGISFESQLRAPILYRGVTVGPHRLDLLVEGCLVVEFKAVKAIENREHPIRSREVLLETRKEGARLAAQLPGGTLADQASPILLSFLFSCFPRSSL